MPGELLRNDLVANCYILNIGLGKKEIGIHDIKDILHLKTKMVFGSMMLKTFVTYIYNE